MSWFTVLEDVWQYVHPLCFHPFRLHAYRETA
jgi:hypothetical protein